MQIKKYIEIPEEILVGLAEGRCVKGSLHRDQWTGRLTFKAYNCQSQRRSKDTLVCPLETGWLKESPQRIKFYSSVKKELGYRLVSVAMHRDLKDAMSKLEVDELLKTEDSL